MLVSITTVTYNSEATLARTIESVLAQTYTQIEYIIVDGKSADNTVAVAESYRGKFKERGIAYRVVSEKDRGMYDAINKGIALSTGEIIGNINSDDWYEPDAVEKVVGFFEKEHCDFMYADLRMIRPDGSSFIKHSKKTRIATSRGWNHPTQFARREVYERFPYKVESLHDDFDLLLRVLKSGYKVAILNEVLANFTMEGMSHERKLSANIARGKARYRIYRCNGYSRLYLLECLLIETAKFILG
jgi:glycosyltransferase involved in cell wall biosynthesis